MELREVGSNEVPTELLLEADPSLASIASYLHDSWCFAAVVEEQIEGVCVVKSSALNCAEIYNVAVSPSQQAKGIGSKLLKFVLFQLEEKGIRRVELGTGTFGYQLTYYQRLGFRIDSIEKDHFLLNYPEPIFENGIQHKDMLRLYVNLPSTSE